MELVHLIFPFYSDKLLLKGVKIPYLKPSLLIKTKLSVRPKDIQDRDFLQKLTEPNKEN